MKTGKSRETSNDPEPERSAGKRAASGKAARPSSGRDGNQAIPASEARAAAPEPDVDAVPARARPGRSSRSGETPPIRRPRARGEAAKQQKLAAILGAALEVFAEKGYAATRLEDVAKRAGVAKGTIYLYVASKEALFEQLVRSSLAGPIASAEEKLSQMGGSAEEALRLLFATLRTQILATRKHEIARIVLAEAGRFPDLADFYHAEVVSRGMGIIRRIAERGMASGEFRSDALVRFPQLAIAPGIVALIWTSLFQRKAPLDVEAMLEEHVTLLVRGLKSEPR